VTSHGVSVARYSVVVQAGEEGMGEIWRAMDNYLGCAVAINLLPETLAGAEALGYKPRPAPGCRDSRKRLD
jgi:hypothetical protein